MDKEKAIMFAMAQSVELARGQGKGFTQAGLESQHAKMSPAERDQGEKIVRFFQEELARQGWKVLPKETSYVL